MSTHRLDDQRHLARAIELSREHMDEGAGGPFGAVIVRDGKVLAEGWNQVTSAKDPTAHAEVTAIRRACEAVGDHSLEGATLYTSCEPCPMCLASAYWARVGAHRLCQYPPGCGGDRLRRQPDLRRDPQARLRAPHPHGPPAEPGGQGGVRCLGGQAGQDRLLMAGRVAAPGRASYLSLNRSQTETNPCPASPPSSASPP